MNVFFNLAPLYVIAAISYFLKHRGIFDKDTAKVITPIIFKVCGPALVYLSLSKQHFDKSSLILIGLGMSFFFIYLLIFQVAKKYLAKEAKTQQALLLGAISFAVGSVAYPLVQVSFPSEVFAQVVILDLAMFILFLGLGPILVSTESNNKKAVFDLLLKNPILIAVYIGALASLTKFVTPAPLLSIVSFAGLSFSFLAAVLLGVTISIPTKEQFRRVTSAVGAKILVWIIIGLLCWFFLPLPIQTKQAIIMTISAPTGIFAIVYSRQYEQDGDFAAQMSVVGVFLMLVFYPILISLIS